MSIFPYINLYITPSNWHATFHRAPKPNTYCIRVLSHDQTNSVNYKYRIWDLSKEIKFIFLGPKVTFIKRPGLFYISKENNLAIDGMVFPSLGFEKVELEVGKKFLKGLPFDSAWLIKASYFDEKTVECYI